MNCKKCGRPMGSKGYCAICDAKKVADKKTADAVKKEKMKKLALYGGIALAVIVAALVLMFHKNIGHGAQ